MKPVQIIPVSEITIEGNFALQPTQPMEAVDLSDKIMNVNDLLTRFVEPYTEAWKALPKSVRDHMIERPQDFRLVSTGTSYQSSVPAYYIVYNGVSLKYNSIHELWEVDNIAR